MMDPLIARPDYLGGILFPSRSVEAIASLPAVPRIDPSDPVWHERFLGEGTLFVRHTRPRPGLPTVVLVHGLSGSLSAWNDLLPHLAGTCDLVLVDQRGHGLSRRGRTLDEYRIEAFADDLAEVVRTLGIHRPVFVAHSFGCIATALHLVRHRVERGKVVFLSARLDPRSRFLAALTRLALPFLRPCAAKPGQVDYRRHPRGSDWSPSRMRADIANTGLFGYVGVLHHASGLDLRARLGEIAVPALFVHGSRDTVFRAARIRKVHREVPGARLEEIPDANHVLVFTHPSEVAAKILDFARESGAP